MKLYKYTLWDRVIDKPGYYYHQVRGWWYQHHYINPLYAAGQKLIELNPEIMPDTVSVRTWTRFGRSLVCDVRLKKFDEKITVGCGMVTKNGMSTCIESTKCCWLWLYRNYERYVIEPQGMNKEKDG